MEVPMQGQGELEDRAGDVYTRVYTLRAEVSRVFSENFYLKPGVSKGARRGKGKNGRGAYLYLSPEARTYKKELIPKLEEEARRAGFPYGKELPFRVCYTFLLNKNRDVTNMIKVTEDALSEAIGVDDSVWSEVCARKVVDEGRENEVVIIELYCR